MEYQRKLSIKGPHNARQVLALLPPPGTPYPPVGHRIVALHAKAEARSFLDWLLRRPRFWVITMTMESDPPEPPVQEKNLVIHENP